MQKIKTRLNNVLKLDTPIFQGPMAGAITPQLASAVANHGGLGVVPLGNWPIENCEKIIDDILSLTKQSLLPI